MDGNLRILPLVLVISVLGASPGRAMGGEPTSPGEAFVARLVHPERQADEVLRLFRGARWSDPAAALAAWKTQRPDAGLGKPAEAVIALFNPEMAREWRSLDKAEIRIGLDAGTGVLGWSALIPRDDGTVAAGITAMPSPIPTIGRSPSTGGSLRWRGSAVPEFRSPAWPGRASSLRAREIGSNAVSRAPVSDEIQAAIWTRGRCSGSIRAPAEPVGWLARAASNDRGIAGVRMPRRRGGCLPEGRVARPGCLNDPGRRSRGPVQLRSAPSNWSGWRRCHPTGSRRWSQWSSIPTLRRGTLPSPRPIGSNASIRPAPGWHRLRNAAQSPGDGSRSEAGIRHSPSSPRGLDLFVRGARHAGPIGRGTGRAPPRRGGGRSAIGRAGRAAAGRPWGRRRHGSGRDPPAPRSGRLDRLGEGARVASRQDRPAAGRSLGDSLRGLGGRGALGRPSASGPSGRLGSGGLPGSRRRPNAPWPMIRPSSGGAGAEPGRQHDLLRWADLGDRVRKVLATLPGDAGAGAGLRIPDSGLRVQD